MATAGGRPPGTQAPGHSAALAPGPALSLAAPGSGDSACSRLGDFAPPRPQPADECGHIKEPSASASHHNAIGRRTGIDTSLGTGHFITWVSTYTDQNGEVLGRQRFRVFRFKPAS
jgi:hypothetical protein